MTALDIIVIVIVGGSAFAGYRRGFVHELFSLGALVAGIAAVKSFHAPVAAALLDLAGDRFVAALYALVLIFGVVFVAARLIATRVGRATRASFVGPVDRILGAGFGLLKGLLGATLLFLLANLVTRAAFAGRTDKPQWLVDARTYPLLNATSRALVDFVDRRRNAPPPTDEELNR